MVRCPPDKGPLEHYYSPPLSRLSPHNKSIHQIKFTFILFSYLLNIHTYILYINKMKEKAKTLCVQEINSKSCLKSKIHPMTIYDFSFYLWRGGGVFTCIYMMSHAFLFFQFNFVKMKVGGIEFHKLSSYCHLDIILSCHPKHHQQ